MRRLALATCAAFPDLHPDDRLLIPALAAAGFAAEPVRWDDARASWRTYAAVILRSTWDYFEREAEFRAWLSTLESEGVRVLNPVPIVRDNLDKSYLERLAAAGVPTVPTVWLEKGDPRPPSAWLADVPWDDLVVKPSVGAGAFRTHRTTRRDLLADGAFLHQMLRDARVLVQPFLPEIVSRGEWSFVYFGDRWSHAVVKRAKPGDFRVQWTHGGRHETGAPSADLRRAVDDVFRRLPGGCLYSRLDGVESGGRFLLVELERTEPYLYLGESEGAPGRFADAARQLLG